METDREVDAFLRSIRETKPPWECPKCHKIYKTYPGMEHHMLNFDHNAAAQTPNQKPLPSSSSSRKPARLKFSNRKRGGRPAGNMNRRSPSPIAFMSPARDTLTWAEAQRLVEVESEGKIYR